MTNIEAIEKLTEFRQRFSNTDLREHIRRIRDGECGYRLGVTRGWCARSSVPLGEFCKQHMEKVFGAEGSVARLKAVVDTPSSATAIGHE